MKKAHLKWLFPLLSLILMLTVACLIQGGVAKKRAVDLALLRVSNEVSNRLFESDLVIKTAIDYNDALSDAFKRLNFDTDKVVMVEIISGLERVDCVDRVVICNSEGNGYDDRGNAVSLRNETFFDYLKENYAKGGSGIIFVYDDGIVKSGSIGVVNRVTFADDAKGYLVSFVDRNASENVINSMEMSNIGAIVSINGDVTATTSGAPSNIIDFWSQIPEGVPKDSIKLSLTQKNNLISEIPGYGYVVVVASTVTAGGAMMLFDYDNIDRLTHNTMLLHYHFVFILAMIIAIYIALAIATLVVSRLLMEKRTSRMSNEFKKDEVTGLYSKDGCLYEIDRYISESLIKGGILFLVMVENFARIRVEKGDEVADRAIRDFSDTLRNNFRSTDLIGRISDDSFVVFMKDIEDEKEVRRETDQFQMAMYDLRVESNKGGKALNIYSGGAFYPGEGKNAGELLESAMRGVEVSRKTGK